MQQATHTRFLDSQLIILNSLLDPLSSVTVPLLYGLARRLALRGGATQRQARVNGMTISYFRQEPRNGAAEAGGPRNSRAAGQPAHALPILLVHGIGDNALSWSIVMRLLARDHQV